MKRLSFIASLLALPVYPLAWAQTGTVPEGWGAGIRTPQGLRQLIERQDPGSAGKGGSEGDKRLLAARKG